MSIRWNLGHGVGLVLATTIVITSPSSTMLKVGVVFAGSLALLPWSIGRMRRRAPLRAWPLIPVGIGLAVLGWGLVSAIGSGAPWGLSLYGWYGRNFGLLALAALAALLVTTATLRRDEVRSALLWTLGAASLAALVSLAQAAGWEGFSNPLGYEGEPSLLGNPNFAAGFFAITATLGVGLTLQRSTVLVRVATASATALQVVGLLLATSQQGPVALVAGLAAGCILMGLAGAQPTLRWASALVGGVAAIGLTLLGALALAGTGPGAAVLRSSTLAIRLEYWKAAWATMTGVPIFGTGPDGLTRFIAEFRPESYVALIGPATRVDSAHSVPLQFAATLGVLGLVLWVAFALAVTVTLAVAAWSWHGNRPGQSALLLATVGAGWAAYVTQSLVSVEMIVLPMLGWSLAGMGVALVRPDASDTDAAQPRSPARLLVASAILGALGLLVALPGYLAERMPSLTTVDEAYAAVESTVTPCPVRLAIINSVRQQVDLTTYAGLVQAAAAADPRCPPITAIYAEVGLQAGELTLADEQSRHAVEFDPLDYQAWLLRARVLSALGDEGGAAAAFSEAERTAGLWPGSDPAALDVVRDALGLPGD